MELPPGVWPEIILITNETHSGFLFFKGAPVKHGDELVGYDYSTRNGDVELNVLND
jgi:hypothetical protein